MRMAQVRRTAMWLLVGVIIVSLGRTIAYALAGGTIASRLSEQAGGAHPAMVAAVSLSIAVGVSAVGLWLVATGLRERSRLQLEGWSQEPPALGIARVAQRATLLSAATIVVFTTFESCLHYEEGLGFHGWHCIAGPVHQNAAPILIGLSLVAAAIVTAVDAMLAAGRRLVARLMLARRAAPRRTGRRALPSGAPLRARLVPRFTPARGPPFPA
jgi:hypothetical protein